MAFIKRFCKYTAIAFGLLILACLVRTFVLINSRKNVLPKCSPKEGRKYIELNSNRWERFRDSLRFKTITSNLVELKRMANYIIEAHPIIFNSNHVTYEIVNNYSLLIHVQGKNKNLLPYLIAAHLDVVPVVEDEWEMDPFSAIEDENQTLVYGRGALDCKGPLMAQLAAVEFMLENEDIPERSFYLAYGHDEEVLGPSGCPEIAKTLRSKGVNKLHYVIDEGLVVLKNALPGPRKDVAFIGVTERGFMNMKLSVELPGGHSSIPASETALGVLAGAVSRLETTPMQGRVDDLVETMLETWATVVGFPFNVFLSNVWLFKPLLWRILAMDQRMQGIVRTTTAITIFQAGNDINVIPASAWAFVNQRMHPMDTFEDVLRHNRETINDDRVKINVLVQNPPHPISPYNPVTDLPYQVLTDTIGQIYEDHPVSAATLVGNTDTRCYLDFTENVYRFYPFALTNDDVASIHAKHERISKENYDRMMNFYFHLIQNSDRIHLRNLMNEKGEL